MSAALLTIGGIVGMAAVVYVIARMSHVRTDERVHCPLKDRDAEVGFERKLTATWAPGERVDVTRCSELPDPEHVTCAKDCLHDTRPAEESAVSASGR
jgi:hypothetical protein